MSGTTRSRSVYILHVVSGRTDWLVSTHVVWVRSHPKSLAPKWIGIRLFPTMWRLSLLRNFLCWHRPDILPTAHQSGAHRAEVDSSDCILWEFRQLMRSHVLALVINSIGLLQTQAPWQTKTISITYRSVRIHFILNKNYTPQKWYFRRKRSVLGHEEYGKR